MKKFSTTLLSLLILLSPTFSIAQVATGGPDTFGYIYRNHTVSNGPNYQWFDISTIGTSVSGLADDNFVGPFGISGFSYYGTSPTSLYIGSNGYIAFNPVNIASAGATFPAIPTLGGPNNFIAPMLTDLTFSGASTNPGRCYYYNQGDTICVTWEAVPFWVNNTNQYAGDNTFQVILNKRDSSITFNYKKQVGLPDPVYINNFVSIGIENGTGADGLQYFRGSTFPTPNTSVKYYYPTIVAPLTDLSIDWVENDQNGGFFKVVGQNYAPQIKIKNVGNQNISSSFYVGYNIYDPIGLRLDSGSVLVNGINAGSDTLINFSSQIKLLTADRYDLRGHVSRVPNDNVIVNDSQSVRLIVLDTTLATNFLDYTDRSGSIFSISWSGGNGGIACYYEPPYYPARVISSNFYITNLGTPAVGFHSILYDDNGRQGARGTILDSSFIPSSSILTNQYYSHPLIAQNIVIPSGGVYLLWLMGGNGIAIGRVIETPASNRSYEVLFGAWAPYRSGDTEDFAMGVEVAPITTDLEEGISSLNDFNVYPNPAVEYVTIEGTDLKNVLNSNDYQLMDLQGRSIDAKLMNFGDHLRLYRGNLSAGNYVLRIGRSIAKIQFTD